MDGDVGALGDVVRVRVNAQSWSLAVGWGTRFRRRVALAFPVADDAFRRAVRTLRVGSRGFSARYAHAICGVPQRVSEGLLKYIEKRRIRYFCCSACGLARGRPRGHYH